MAFLTELTIEISDFTVVLLAIHTALSVFSTRYSAGQGLYQFRYGAFLFFIFVALIFSIVSVIPMSHTIRSGYQEFTTWCYLRLSPSWYRFALSWIPECNHGHYLDYLYRDICVCKDSDNCGGQIV